MFCLKSEKPPCNILGITARQWVRQLMQFPRIIGQLKHNVGNCVQKMPIKRVVLLDKCT